MLCPRVAAFFPTCPRCAAAHDERPCRTLALPPFFPTCPRCAAAHDGRPCRTPALPPFFPTCFPRCAAAMMDVRVVPQHCSFAAAHPLSFRHWPRLTRIVPHCMVCPSLSHPGIHPHGRPAFPPPCVSTRLNRSTTHRAMHLYRRPRPYLSTPPLRHADPRYARPAAVFLRAPGLRQRKCVDIDRRFCYTAIGAFRERCPSGLRSRS